MAGCCSLQTGLADRLMGTALVDSQPVVLRCHPQLRTVADSTCRVGLGTSDTQLELGRPNVSDLIDSTVLVKT